MELRWWPDADSTMAHLERSANSQALRTVRRTLGELEIDPFHPRLGTRQFQTPGLGHVRATPVRGTSWWVLWQLADAADAVEIVLLSEFDL